MTAASARSVGTHLVVDRRARHLNPPYCHPTGLPGTARRYTRSPALLRRVPQRTAPLVRVVCRPSWPVGTRSAASAAAVSPGTPDRLSPLSDVRLRGFQKRTIRRCRRVRNAAGTLICSMYGYFASRNAQCRAGLFRIPSSRNAVGTLWERLTSMLAVCIWVCWQPRPSPTCRWERPLPSPLPWSRLQTAREPAGHGLARP